VILLVLPLVVTSAGGFLVMVAPSRPLAGVLVVGRRSAERGEHAADLCEVLAWSPATGVSTTAATTTQAPDPLTALNPKAAGRQSAKRHNCQRAGKRLREPSDSQSVQIPV
jgi:hypothetical protein